MFGKSSIIQLSLAVCCVALAACGVPPSVRADSLASQAGLKKQEVQTGYFLLTSYLRITDPTKPLRIYIEGDGLAWLTATDISPNPTPHTATGLLLATRDPAENVIYLARPCQYTPLERDPHCDDAYWTSKRFSEEVITSMNEAIDRLTRSQHMSATPSIELIGYSGGGAVAALLAARRHDVVSLRTVAGNLDHVEVNRLHEVTPLAGSLNAIDIAGRIATLPQLHFSGAEDTVVPPSIAQKFAAASGSTGCFHTRTLAGVNHDRGWAERWPELLKEPVECAAITAPAEH